MATAALAAVMAGAGVAVPATVAGAGPVTRAGGGSLANQASALQAQIVATGQQLHRLAVASQDASARLAADTAAVQRSQAELVTLRARLARTTVESRRLALETYMGADGGADSLAGLFGRSSSDAVAGQAYAGMASDAMATAIDRYHRDQVAVARQVAAQAAEQADAARAYQALGVEYAGLQQSVSQEQAMLDQVQAQQLVLAVQQQQRQAAGPPAAVPVGSLAAPSGSMAEDLARLRQCESGDNYRDDTGNGYYGAYQFSMGTWQGLGYSGLPSDAPPPTQDQAAMRLEQRSGWGQWPACAAMLGLT